jgi:DNA-binding CsgD family transcriptional regulator/tetratricopeptide (TPR) repeat protein
MTPAALRCPIVAGRDGERAQIADLLLAARAGRGGMVAVEGEGGIGKSRLAADAVEQAAGRGMRTLLGRAVPGGDVAFRPLAEALLSSQRAGAVPLGPALAPYRAALGRLVPDWREGPDSGEGSLLVVAEAAVRVLAMLAGDHGLLVVVEDLHWSDPETLAVLEYAADNLADCRIALLATFRPKPDAAATMFRRLARRGAAGHVELGALAWPNVVTMTAACLGVDAADVPMGLTELMEANAAGLPLVVEDLLAAAAATGSLRRGDDGWSVGASLDALRPRRYAETVHERLAVLSPGERAVVDVAALLGVTFDWALLGPVLDMTTGEVAAALAAATGLDLLATTDGGIGFRHALIRDVVLDALLPPTRALLGRRAAEVLEAAGSVASDQAACLLAAELRTAAGDRDRAAELLLAGGRAAVARGALLTAAELLRRGWRLAPGGPLEAQLGAALVEALTLGGDAPAALDAAPAVVPAVERTGSGPSARLHAVLARAAMEAGRFDVARRYLDRARAATDDDALLARIAALDAHLALASITGDRLVAAEHLARRAVAAAQAAALPDVECEALEVVGRAARVRDLARAEEAFGRALAVADRHGLALWRLRALNELGTVDMFRTLDPARLEQARAEAERAGALSTACGVDVNLAALYTMRGEYGPALEAAGRCEGVARRYRLPVLAAAQLFQAVVATHEGRFRDMQALVRAAEATSGDDPDILIGTWSMCRAMRSLLREDRQRAHQELATAAEKASASPTLAINPCDGPRLLLRAVDGHASAADVDAFEATNAVGARWSELWGGMARAVVAGRAGDTPAAGAAFDRADAAGRPMPLFWLVAVRLAAEGAVADGWGDPAGWLIDTERALTARGHEPMASACRSLLRRSGSGPTRSRRRDATVDAGLRRHGVTAREAEVLALVGARMSNREIAERLYLSPRTVEKHVASLLAKTGAGSRSALAAAGRDLEDGGAAPM